MVKFIYVIVQQRNQYLWEQISERAIHWQSNIIASKNHIHMYIGFSLITYWSVGTVSTVLDVFNAHVLSVPCYSYYRHCTPTICLIPLLHNYPHRGNPTWCCPYQRVPWENLERDSLFGTKIVTNHIACNIDTVRSNLSFGSHQCHMVTTASTKTNGCSMCCCSLLMESYRTMSSPSCIQKYMEIYASMLGGSGRSHVWPPTHRRNSISDWSKYLNRILFVRTTIILQFTHSTQS